MRRHPRTWIAPLLLGLSILVAGCGESPGPVPDAASKRDLPAGEVVGFEGRYGSHAWLGLPFAHPPVGDLRWRAPRSAPRWPGTREALAQGSPCTQLASRFGGVADAPEGSVVGSEDCLTLNVWAPRFAAVEVPRGDARLPVMLWIHGGGNRIGHVGFYDGGNLAASRGVIVVAVQYRLGPLGWLRHASLRGPGTTELDRSGNYGTLDLVRALEWVRENVAAFGGDPDNVTIFGESAGGRNVLSLLLSPVAKGLFQRAIVQSGGLESASPAEAENFADADVPGQAYSSNEAILSMLVADGRAPDRETARHELAAMADAEITAWLRGRSAAEILAAYGSHRTEGLADLPILFRDGVTMPEGDLHERFARAEAYNAVPTILGTTRDEDKLFMAFDPEWSDVWLGMVPRPRDLDRFDLVAEYRSKAWKATGADELAARMRGAQGPSVWVYRFDWDEEPRIPLLIDLARVLGAFHSLEIPFVFGHWDLGPQSGLLFLGNAEGREALGRQMASYWTEFARVGAPGRGREGSLPEWEPWDGDGGRFLVFDTEAGGGLRLSSEGVSVAGLLRAIDEDPRLPTAGEKCDIYSELLHNSEAITEAEYATLAAAKGCDTQLANR
jgi:para-nitrobenzyl esterase